MSLSSFIWGERKGRKRVNLTHMSEKINSN